MLTMDIHTERHPNGGVLPAFRDLHLSQDSIYEAMALGVDEEIKPVKREGTVVTPSLKISPRPARSNKHHQPNSMSPLQTCLETQSSDVLLPVPELIVPKIPPRIPITKGRPRSISESEVTSSSRRRAIFGQYWTQGSNVVGGERSTSGGVDHTLHPKDNTSGLNVTETPPPRNRVRKRSSSMTLIETSGIFPEPFDYRMFAPPKEHADRSSICGRFASVEDVPSSSLMDSLPPLPSPLRRFCSEGDSPGFLHGMYPLMTPIPILRQSSYRSLFEDKGSGNTNKAQKPTWAGTYGQGSFNLTKSWRPDRAISFDAVSSTSSSDESSGSAMNRKAVCFDPRVTVTEFEDPIERSWYNDMELEHLKIDTILLAQEYLLTHPDQAERYNRAILDPVTSTYRKKALFSLPILSTTEDESMPSPDHKEYEALIKSQVKTILIVDPNKAILDLFCKSMHSMFPSARLYKTQSGDEALQLVSDNLQCGMGTPRNFDIIVVEQRLFQPQKVDETKTPTGSLQSMSERGGTVPYLGMPKPGSFSERARCTGGEMSGSEVLKTIQRLEDQAFPEEAPSESSGSKEVSVTCSKPIHRSSLLIGVSMQPDRDAKDFQVAGADIVWGKPIPRVGDALRNQLLHTLVNKRRRSLTGGKPQIEEETV
jgi:hypothetical protein